MKELFIPQRRLLRARTLDALAAGSALVTPNILRGVRTCDSNAYTYRMPGGIPGDVNRIGGGATIEPQNINASAPVLAYGLGVVIDANGARSVAAGDATTEPLDFGLAVRPYPLQASAATNFGAVALGTAAVPPVAGVLDVLKRGYMTVLVVGTPAKGGQVYCWSAVSGGGHTQGGIEAASPVGGGNGFVVAGALFTGTKDANGNVEIAFNI